jgi:hypothetical protein
MKLRSYSGFAVAITALIGLTGCSERVKTVPVYGKITFADREPPGTCDIIFRPTKTEGPLRPTCTQRDADGSYRVKAFKDSRGVVPGTYHVKLVFHDLKPGRNPALESSWNVTDYDGGEVEVGGDSGSVEYNIQVQTKKS